MGTMTILRSTYPRITRGARRPVDLLSRIGDHMLFSIMTTEPNDAVMLMTPADVEQWLEGARSKARSRCSLTMPS